VNVGVLHTAVSGAEGHDTYAPCSPSDLAKPRYEYFALGHVHERRVVNDGQWTAAFSGNLQGRHANETGPKGALVVDLVRGERAETRFVPLDVARWDQVEVDASGCGAFDDVLDLVEARLTDSRAAAEGRPLVARVTVTGTTRVAGALSDRERLTEEVRSSAIRTGVTVEKVVSRARMPQAAGSADDRLVDAVLRRSGELTEGLVNRLAAPLRRDFGRALRKDSPLDLNDPAVLERITSAALTGLVAKMTAEES
jgi:exonuclease SbcD